ncbi:hypothetical protein FY534_14270 (plasmid) [Alicyclobacillus sp. TC]|nr:glucosaminidase domain-containing protein [Alicyclobacillus sp. TC]QRF24935.1 hypothetical protein FY534_14270 [Alicyclobacillus sp. TC]
MSISASQLVLYAATTGDLEKARGIAAALQLPSTSVQADFYNAWNQVTSGDYLVIAVGGAALDSLYYNQCGWSNPAGEAGGSTPFAIATAPRDTLPGANYFVNGAGATASDTLYISAAYAYYALYGEYPTEFPSPPSPEDPSAICESSFNSDVSCPCSSSSSSGSCSFPSSPPTSCSSNQQTFINNYLSYAETASSQTGLPVSFILGHWGLETAWGTSAGLPSCNNPGNLVVSGQPTCTTCGGCRVSSFSTLADGVNAYISAMNNNHAFVKWAYDNYGLEESCKAIGGGCEPGSGYTANIYATGRYNGVYCVINGYDEAVDNNCYMNSTTAGNGQSYYSCSDNISGYDEGVVQNSCVSSCNGCGWVGCSLYSTVTSNCLSSYNCVS